MSAIIAFFDQFEAIGQHLQQSAAEVCTTIGLVYSTFRRWVKRISSGLFPLSQPGHKSHSSICYTTLVEQIKKLSHGLKRTAGAGIVHKKMAGKLPREEVRELFRFERREAQKKRRDSAIHIEWHTPNICWAMDATMYGRTEERVKVSVQQVMDTSSKYLFAPLSAVGEPAGEAIAQQLDSLIQQHGAPLFLKRDGGANQNHRCINELLNKYGIIPLNSPPYYPKYSGAIERTQELMKSELQRELNNVENISLDHFAMYAKLAAHNLNHKERRSLNRKNACTVFNAQKRVTFTRWERVAILEELKERLAIMLEPLPPLTDVKLKSLWRQVIANWLSNKNHITMKRNGKVLPYFPDFSAH